MKQYYYKVPKIVTAMQIDFNNYQSLVDAIIMCGHDINIDSIKKYIDENRHVKDGEVYIALQNFHDSTSNVKLCAKHGDYVAIYSNVYSGTIIVEVIEKIVFERYCVDVKEFIRQHEEENNTEEVEEKQ